MAVVIFHLLCLLTSTESKEWKIDGLPLGRALNLAHRGSSGEWCALTRQYSSDVAAMENMFARKTVHTLNFPVKFLVFVGTWRKFVKISDPNRQGRCKKMSFKPLCLLKTFKDAIDRALLSSLCDGSHLLKSVLK